MQILAAQTKKNVEYFKVKWAGINDKGSTWEPVDHLVGDDAKAALRLFKEKRAREAAAHEEARKASLAQLPADVEVDDDTPFLRETAVRGRRRRQSSAAWKHYGNKYFDNDLKGLYTNCKHCNKAIKVVNTSNLMAHIAQKHPELLTEEKVSERKVRI